MRQIINHLLDNDLYKFSMQHAVINMFPYAKVKYEFINRGKTKFPEGFAEELERQVKLMENIQLSKEQKQWFKETCSYFPPPYFDFLYGYRYDPSEVQICQINGDLKIKIEGYWHRTILWEVPLLALISELYYEMIGKEGKWDRVIRKANNINKGFIFGDQYLYFSEFGTRRRESFVNQNEVIHDLYEVMCKSFVGTSNVYFSWLYNIVPKGTHAHEWFMFHAAKYGYKIANHLALEHWSEVFRGDLGIALSDTFTSDIFFKAFDKKFAKLYDGVRHDSGDPFEFTDKTIDHYNKLGINPATKTIIFSDSLNVESAIKVKEYCENKISCSFGIGTSLTNDVNLRPLNIVIKMTGVKPEGVNGWVPTIKLSDVKGKYTGDSKEIKMAQKILNL